jgi:hypothetical protein
MFNQQAAELFGLEHRFPFGWALAALVGTANIAESPTESAGSVGRRSAFVNGGGARASG